jgi:hypothetical protein
MPLSVSSEAIGQNLIAGGEILYGARQRVKPPVHQRQSEAKRLQDIFAAISPGGHNPFERCDACPNPRNLQIPGTVRLSLSYEVVEWALRMLEV